MGLQWVGHEWVTFTFTAVFKCLYQQLSPKRQPNKKASCGLSLYAASNKDCWLEWCQGWRSDLQADEVFKRKCNKILYSHLFYIWNVSFFMIFTEMCCFINNDQFLKDGPFHAKIELIQWCLLIITSQGTGHLCSHFQALFFFFGRFPFLSSLLYWVISSNYQSRYMASRLRCTCSEGLQLRIAL